MIRFCPQCGASILEVLEEIPADDCNDPKTIASCGDCNLVVHVFHLERVCRPGKPVSSGEWEKWVREMSGDWEAQG